MNCMVCSEVVESSLRVFYPGTPSPFLPHPQKPTHVSVKEVPLAKSAGFAVLAITDGKSAEHEKLDYVQGVEEWMHCFPDAFDMPESEAVRFMDLAVPPEIDELLADDAAEYARAVISECARLWRSMAKRLHPDKSCSFWAEGDRLARMQRAFAYCNNVQEHVQRIFAAYLVDRVAGICVDYGLTETNSLFLRLRFQPQEDVATVVFFSTDDDMEMEVELQTRLVETTSFNEEEYPYMFCEEFDGFRLTHRVLHGPHKDVDSHVVRVFEAVPHGLLQSQKQIAQEMAQEDKSREEARLTGLRRQLDEIADMLRKRKRGARGANKRRTQYYEGQKMASARWASAPWHRTKTWKVASHVPRAGRRVPTH